MMRDLGKSIGDAIFENVGRAAGRVQEKSPLPADVLESDDAYLVVFDAPGVEAGDVQVRYVEDRVEVRLDRFRNFHDGFEMLYPGRGLSLSGEATLPDDAAVDAGEATATLRENGTLHVRVPKVTDFVDESLEEADEREEAGSDVEEADDEWESAGEGSADDESTDEDSADDSGPTSVVERVDDEDSADED